MTAPYNMCATLSLSLAFISDAIIWLTRENSTYWWTRSRDTSSHSHGVINAKCNPIWSRLTQICLVYKFNVCRRYMRSRNRRTLTFCIECVVRMRDVSDGPSHRWLYGRYGDRLDKWYIHIDIRVHFAIHYRRSRLVAYEIIRTNRSLESEKHESSRLCSRLVE